MANTTIATGDGIAVKQYDRSIMAEMGKKIFWASMMGKEENNIVQSKVDLQKGPGDRITINFIPNLSGAGVSGDAESGNVIEGNEETLTPYVDTVTIDAYFNATRLGGLLTEQRAPKDLREEARKRLSTWGGEKVDSLGYTAIESSPTRYYAEISDTLTLNGATASVTATDLVEPMMAPYLAAYAATTSPKIKPIKVNGEDTFIFLLHTHCEFDMKNDSTWQAFHRDADVRDPKDNYLFKTGMGRIGGVLLYSNESVATASDWGSGSNVNGAKNKFLGAQAMAVAWAKLPFMVEKRFDYGIQWGACVGMVLGFRKLQFNSQDWGVAEIRTARTAIGS